MEMGGDKFFTVGAVFDIQVFATFQEVERQLKYLQCH